MSLKDSSGEQLVVLASVASIELSQGLDGDSILALSDFFGLVTGCLIAIADRKLYTEQQLKDTNSENTTTQDTNNVSN